MLRHQYLLCDALARLKDQFPCFTATNESPLLGLLFVLHEDDQDGRFPARRAVEPPDGGENLLADVADSRGVRDLGLGIRGEFLLDVDDEEGCVVEGHRSVRSFVRSVAGRMVRPLNRLLILFVHLFKVPDPPLEIAAWSAC